MKLTAFVLAGGASRRMGRDKASLPWGETTLLGHAEARLRAVTPDVRLLSGRLARYPDSSLPAVADAAATGPLGAIFSGLLATDADWALFLAVDLPLVPVSLLSALADAAHGIPTPGANAIVPCSRRGPEPLCAVYARPCLEAVQARLAMVTSERSPLRLLSDLSASLWSEAQIRRFGDPDLVFRNVNDPEAYRSAFEAWQP